MTGRQRAMLAFLHDTLARTGRCPSLDEIGAHFDRKASSISRLLKRLEADGLIRRRARQRQVEVIQFTARSNLLFEELAWCQANPERVRAMMALTGAAIGRPATEPAARP